MNVFSKGPILIVEDNPDDLLFLRRALSAAHIENPIDEMKDGQEALQELRGRVTDPGRIIPLMTILDLGIPGKSGLDLLEWLRSQSALRRMVVIVLSGSRKPADIQRAYDLGANAYLAKPVDFEKLVEIIRALKAFWSLCEYTPPKTLRLER